MKNKGLTAILIIVLPMSVVGIYYLVKYILKKRAEKAAATVPPASKPGTVPPSVKPATQVSVFPLKNGSRGNEVRALQTYLNGKMPAPMAKLTVDGIFGAKTEAAVKSVFNTSSVTEALYKSVIK